jgi:cytoskeletal protein RodZ
MADKKEKSTRSEMYSKESRSFDRSGFILGTVLVIVIGSILGLLVYQSKSNDSQVEKKTETITQSEPVIKVNEESSVELIDTTAKVKISISVKLPTDSLIESSNSSSGINPEVVFSGEEYQLEIRYKRDELPLLYEVSDASIVETTGSLTSLYYFEVESIEDYYLYSFDIFTGLKCDSGTQKVEEPCALNTVDLGYGANLEMKCKTIGEKSKSLRLCNEILKNANISSSSY